MLRSLVLAGSTLVAAAQAPAPLWTPSLMLQVKTIEDVRPGPGGKRVAFTVTSPVLTADRSEFVSQIHVWEDGRSRPVTFAEKSSSDPRWSPDGERLAFLSSRGDTKQIYVISMKGGEAEALTEATGALGSFAWSPDGQRIAFTMTDPASEDEARAVKGKDDARWHQENLKYARLYVVSLTPDGAGRREPVRVTRGNREVGSFHWAPDGTRIVYGHARSDRADDWPSTQLGIVTVATGQELAPAVPAAEGVEPRYSPDGAWIAFTQNDGQPRWATHSRLALMPAAGGPVRQLPETPDGQPQLLGWARDGHRLVFTEQRGTLAGLYAMDTASGRCERLDSGAGLLSEVTLDPAGERIGFVLERPDRAPEAYQSPLAGFKPIPVSSVQTDRGLPLGRTELIHWPGPDGQEVEGLLTYPVGYRQGQKVPLLLNVHGGPSGVFGQSYLAKASNYPIAAFAAHGFAILRPNPRGSSGYGWAFRVANQQDWGGKDYLELMAGVDRVIALGVADPQRLGVMGWSYGGFMSSWIITQTQRFQAASIGAAVTDLTSFNGTTDIPSFVPDYLGGDSWERPDTYARFGAMTQIGKARTPTLIQHCEGDVRVPISQGYELFNALQRQGVEVRMLVLPRQAHSPKEPKARLKVMQTNLDWFISKLKP